MSPEEAVMKSNYFGNVSFAMFVLLASTSAFAQSRMEATVPFAFHVGSTAMPAGHYQIVENHILGNLKVSNLDNHSMAIATVQQDSPRDDVRYKMVFHQVSGEYFLSAIHEGGQALDVELPVSKLEKQYRATQVANRHLVAPPEVQIALK
jgi:hypothetical protein